MRAWLRERFAAPAFPGDRRSTHRAAVLNLALLILLGVTPALLLANLLGDVPPFVYAVNVLSIAVVLLLRALLRRGKVDAAGAGLVVYGLVAVTAALASIGTVRAPTALLYVLLIVTAGLVFGSRGMVATIGACALAIVGLITAQNAGVLPEPSYAVGATQAITMTVILAWAGGLTSAAIVSLRKALADADAQLAGRERAEAELAEHLGNLERTVARRTEELTRANARLTAEAEERSRAEASLRESEQRFSAAFHGSPETVVITRLPGGEIVDVNDGFCATTGYRREEVIGRTPLDLDLWAEPTERDRVIAALTATRRIRSLECRFRRRSGELFTGLLSADVVAMGSELCALSTIHDISGRKLLEDEREALIGELRASLARVRTLSGLIPICMHCRKVRDDRGYWNLVEAFIREHTEADFSHGVCPECLEKHYPESR